MSPYHHFNGCNTWSVSLSIPDIADMCLLSIHFYWSFQSILLIFFEERYFCFIEFPYCVLVSNSISFCFYLYNCPPCICFVFVVISCNKNLDYWFVNISWYTFPSLSGFSHVSHIFISLIEVYPYYFLFFERLPLLLMGYWEVACLTYNYLETFPLCSYYWFPVWFHYGQRTYSA